MCDWDGLSFLHCRGVVSVLFDEFLALVFNRSDIQLSHECNMRLNKARDGELGR